MDVAGGARPLIVVIDDDAAFLHMMYELLCDEGYRVLALSGSRMDRTYEAIRTAKPHLVVLDLHLGDPNTAGLLLEQMRLNSTTAHIPVLLCSADTQALRQKAGLFETRKYDTLDKPFTLEELLAKISKIVDPPPATR